MPDIWFTWISPKKRLRQWMNFYQTPGDEYVRIWTLIRDMLYRRLIVQLPLSSDGRFHGTRMNILPARLKKSMSLTIFIMSPLSRGVWVFSNKTMLFQWTGKPPAKTHSLAKTRASHSFSGKFSFLSVTRFSISSAVSPSRRPEAEWTLIQPPHMFDMDTTSRSFSRNTGSVLRKTPIIKGPLNNDRNLRKSLFKDPWLIFST